MPGQYLGHLPRHDNLYEYLRWEIFPQLGSDCSSGIRVFDTNGSNAVYIYEDCKTGIRVVGKFFFSEKMQDWDLAWKRLDREYKNINEFRSYISGCHYVARALGRNDILNRLLVIEYCSGESLESIINRAITSGDDALLFHKLTALAWFLAELHNNSAIPGSSIDFHANAHYFGMLLDHLNGTIRRRDRAHLHDLNTRWFNTPEMWQDNRVMVHGDATPANFFFGDGMYVISFDLERVRRTDRIFDVGRIAGELQHFFLRATGNKYAAEPFIGHFLWEYSCHFPDREKTFAALSHRVPYYLGMNLLRIARNSYLPFEYRRQLIDEAKLCLQRN